MTDLWNMLVHPLMAFLLGSFGLFRDFGLAIVVVTLGIRIVLYPLYVQQIRSQRVMQELAPAMSELKTKYGKDRRRLSEEQMKLYRERGYNPISGCLPLFLQMPILFAMYSALQQVGFGLGCAGPGPGCTGLTSEQASTILLPFIPNPIPAGGVLDAAAHWLPWISTPHEDGQGNLVSGLTHEDPLRILPILAGVTQLIASVMAMPAKQTPTKDDPQAQMMQTMAYYFPLITVVISWGLPAGLSLYWIATTLFQIVQQYFVTGWGRLVRFVPLLAKVPSPGERDLLRREAAALAEARTDMAQPAPEPKPRRNGKKRGKR
ncbi:MAG: YidC/Oxa1 family membrane protein insertase [Chloroflexi bacterium]|nr:YidC/Oxa1 family membrane protein insertase [Chloroflexota bacterium]